MDITSPTAQQEIIAEHVEKTLSDRHAYPQGARRNRLVCALAALDQKIAQGKQSMGLDYRKITNEPA